MACPRVLGVCCRKLVSCFFSRTDPSVSGACQCSGSARYGLGILGGDPTECSGYWGRACSVRRSGTGTRTMTPARRLRLAWLHRWVGLVSGWVAFAIFLTGTLALFDAELTRWMQPETAIVPYNAQLTPTAITHIQQILHDSEASGAPPSFLMLPDTRDPTLRIFHYDGHGFVGPVLDPRTGAALAPRETEGGSFFFNFHYTLRIPSPWGERLVACVAFAFAAMVFSGLLLHLKRLMPDYFTLRLKASLPRSLLDLHVLTGSAMLPFHIMITWTGLILTAENALPVIQSAQPAQTQVEPASPQPVHWAPQAPLAPMLQQAHTQLGAVPSYVLFEDGKTTFYCIQKNSLNANDVSVVFNSQTGQLLSKAGPASNLEDIFYVMSGLHIARSMGPLLRWLWFGGGLASTIMIGSGLIYYTARQKKQPTASFGFAQRLNIAVIGGLICACLNFFAANRLIPALWSSRSMLEVAIFFGAWGMCLVLAIAVPPRKSWVIISWAIAGVGLAIPTIDWMTVSARTWGTALHLTVNGLCLLTGFIVIAGPRLLSGSKRHG